jgi:ABC-type antimicrobial peptide transport system permease subunit
MTDVFIGNNIEIMIRQADIADTSLSTIDERIGDRLAAMPEIENVSGAMFTAVMLPDAGAFFIVQGYAPKEAAIQRFRIVEGQPLTGNHQIIIGRSISEALNKDVGDTLDLSGLRLRVAGIFESKIGWEEMGGVVSLRDAQVFMGKPRKVTMYAVNVRDPEQAEGLVASINQEFPELHASLAGDFVSQMPDMKNSKGMTDGIAMLAILVGGVGVLNTMLMSVFERTREIGVLRALGWRRRQVLGLILREALLLGILGGVAGILVAQLMVVLIMQIPSMVGLLSPQWSAVIIARAVAVALLLGLLGGLYPAYRATRLQPIEALRYE